MKLPVHTPIRTCLGCGGRTPQDALVRLVLAADGAVTVVHRRGCSGRSGYLHRRPECWARFAARQGQVRSLGSRVDKSARAALVQELQKLTQLGMMVR